MQDDIRETAEFQVVEAFHAAQFAPGTAHVHAAEDCVPTSDGAQPTSIAPPGFYPSLASISISSCRSYEGCSPEGVLRSWGCEANQPSAEPLG